MSSVNATQTAPDYFYVDPEGDLHELVRIERAEMPRFHRYHNKQGAVITLHETLVSTFDPIRHHAEAGYTVPVPVLRSLAMTWRLEAVEDDSGKAGVLLDCADELDRAINANK